MVKKIFKKEIRVLSGGKGGSYTCPRSLLSQGRTGVLQPRKHSQGGVWEAGGSSQLSRFRGQEE